MLIFPLKVRRSPPGFFLVLAVEYLSSIIIYCVSLHVVTVFLNAHSTRISVCRSVTPEPAASSLQRPSETFTCPPSAAPSTRLYLHKPLLTYRRSVTTVNELHISAILKTIVIARTVPDER